MTTATFTQTTWTTSTSTCPGGVCPEAGFVADDPVTFYNNKLQTFYLPNEGLSPLLQTPEFHFFGSAFMYGSEQWINRLVVTGPTGEPVIQISIKPDIESFNKASAPPNAFESMNISLDWLNIPLVAVPPPTSYAYRWKTIDFAFGEFPEGKIGDARAEIVIIDAKTARIIVVSTASEDVDHSTAAKTAHLDFTIQMHSRDTCEGILPELWGIKPLSERTEALLEPLAVADAGTTSSKASSIPE